MNDKLAFSIIDFDDDATVSKNFLSNVHLNKIRSNAELNEQEKEKFSKMYDKRVEYHQNGIYIAKDIRGLYVEYNPNKLLSVQPTQQITFDNLKESFNIVNHQLNEIGIKCNLNESKVQKYHQCFDVAPNEQYSYYLPTILTLKPKREIRNSDKKIFENSFYMQNKTQQVTIYNKAKEASLDFNCIRLEHRINKLPKNDKFLIGNLNDDYFRYLKQNSYRIIEQTVFSYLNDDTISNENNLASMLLNLVANNSTSKDIIQGIFATVVNDDLQKRDITANQLFKHIKARNIDDTRNPQYTTVQAIKRILDNFKLLNLETLEPYKKLHRLYQSVKVA